MEFIVYGQPRGKERPRFARKTGTTYTPKRTRDYEAHIRSAFKSAPGCERIPADCSVAVSVEAYFSIPKSYSKASKQACMDNSERPRKKPDGDNILKVVLDALNGLAYEDDRQVVDETIHKYYTSGDGFIVVRVRESKT